MQEYPKIINGPSGRVMVNSREEEESVLAPQKDVSKPEPEPKPQVTSRGKKR